MLLEIYLVLIFATSLSIILVLSKRNIAGAIFLGALFLGFATMSPEVLLEVSLRVFLEIGNIVLAIAISLIPIIGGLLNRKGLLDKMIRNFPFGKKAFLGFSPAFLGLLTIPGGALFSAPLVARCCDEITDIRKASINVWFRHILHIVYPLAPTLIIACELVGCSVYQVVIYLAPYFALSLIVGSIFLLGGIKENKEEKQVNIREFLEPIFIILIAPLIDFTLRTYYHLSSSATFIGIFTALLITVIYSKARVHEILSIARETRAWNFAFLILAVLEYQAVFKNSGISQLVRGISINPLILIVGIGFLLGFLTGRTSTPIVILIPMFQEIFGSLTIPQLALMYYSILLGYIISPVHPCLIVTAEYFGIGVSDIIKDLYKLSLVSLLIGVLLYHLL